MATSLLRTTPSLTPQEVFDAFQSDESQTLRGFKSGLSGLSAGSYASEALAQEQAKDPVWKETRDRALAIQERAAAQGPRISSLRDIANTGDALDYAGGTIGQGVASMLPTLATALLTRGRGKLAAPTAFAGAALSGYKTQRDQAVMGQYQDPTLAAASAEDRDTAATGTGILGAGLEAAVPAGLAASMFRKPVASFASNVARDAVEEAATEGAQQLVSYGGEKYLDADRELDPWDLVDAAVAGGLTGGTMSAAVRAPAHLAAGAASVLPEIKKPGSPGKPAAGPFVLEPDGGAPGGGGGFDGVVDRMKKAAQSAASPADFLKNVFAGTPEDMAAADLRPDSEDPSVLNAADPEAAINARDAHFAERAKMYAEELLKNPDISANTKQRVIDMNGDYSSKANRVFVASNLATHLVGKKITKGINDLGSLADTLAGTVKDAVTGTKKNNLQEIPLAEAAPLVEMLASKLGNNAANAPTLARQLLAAANRIPTGAVIDPESDRRLKNLSSVIDDEMLDMVTELSGSEGLREAINKVRSIPSAESDVEKAAGGSFLESMLTDKNTDPQITRGLAKYVDELGLKLKGMNPTQKTNALRGLSAAFGSVKNAQTVAEYYGNLRREAFDKEAVRDELADDRPESEKLALDESSETTDDYEGTADEDFEAARQGLTTREGPPESTYTFQDAKKLRPFRAFESSTLAGGKQRRTAVQEAINLKGKTPGAYVRPVKMSEYVSDTKGDPEAEVKRLAADVKERIAEHKDRKGEDRTAQINTLKGELELMRSEYKRGGAKAVLDQYEVLQSSASEQNDTVATDKDLKEYANLAESGDARNTQIVFQRKDGTKLKLSAESMWGARGKKEGSGKGERADSRAKRLFYDAVSSVLARPEIEKLVTPLENVTVDRKLGIVAKKKSNPDYVRKVAAALKAARGDLKAFDAALNGTKPSKGTTSKVGGLVDIYIAKENERDALDAFVNDSIADLEKLLDQSREGEGLFAKNLPAQAVAREQVRMLRAAKGKIDEVKFDEQFEANTSDVPGIPGTKEELVDDSDAAPGVKEAKKKGPRLVEEDTGLAVGQEKRKLTPSAAERDAGKQSSQNKQTDTETVMTVRAAIRSLFNTSLDSFVVVRRTAEQLFAAAGINPAELPAGVLFSYSDTQKSADASVRDFATYINTKLDADGLPYISKETRTDGDVNAIATKFLNAVAEDPRLLIDPVNSKKLSVSQYLVDEETGDAIDPNDPSQHWRLSDIGRHVAAAVTSGSISDALAVEATRITEGRNSAIADLIRVLGESGVGTPVERARVVIAASKYATSGTYSPTSGEVRVRADEIGDNRHGVTMNEAIAKEIVKELRAGKGMKAAMKAATATSVEAARRSNKHANTTGWVEFKKGSSPEVLNRAMNGTGWCTGFTDISFAASQISQGSFWAYYEDGEPQIGMRTEDGRMGEPPRGRLEGQRLPPKYAGIAADFLEKGGKVTGGEEFLEARREKLAMRAILASEGEISPEQFRDAVRVVVGKDGEVTFGAINGEKYGAKDVVFPASRIPPQFRGVVGAMENAAVVRFNASSLPSGLREVRGHLVADDLTSAPELREVGKNLYADALTSAPELRKVGKNLSTISLTSAPELREVGGRLVADALTSVPKLERVGEDMEANALTSAPELREVGGHLYADALTFAPELREVGGIMFTDALTSAPKLSVPLDELRKRRDDYYPSEDIPFSRDASGKVQGFVYKKKAYLAADNIERNRARGVLMHELGEHLGDLRGLLGDANYAKLFKAVEGWANSAGKEGEIAKAAIRRAKESGNYETELLAYAIEEAVNAGVKPTAEGVVGKWLEAVMNAFKAALKRLTGADMNLTAQDLVDLAHGTALRGPIREMVAEPRGTKNSTTKNSFAGNRVNPTMAHFAEQALEGGVPADQVWAQTGWFRGPDGKMRTEIRTPKLEAALRERLTNKATRDKPFKIWDVLKDIPAFAAYSKTFLKDVTVIPDTPDSESSMMMELTGVAGSYNPETKEINLGRAGAILGEIEKRVGAPKFTKRVRALAAESDSFLLDMAGVIDSFIKDGVITRQELNGLAIEGTISTAMHELQHALQHVDGFENGGNPAMAVIAKYGNPDEYLKAAREEDFETMDAISEQAFSVMRSEMGPLTEADESTYMHKLYESIIGEVEAADVQSRMDLSDKEAANLKPALADAKREFLRSIAVAEALSLSRASAMNAGKKPNLKTSKKDILAEITRIRGKDVRVKFKTFLGGGASGAYTISNDKIQRLIEISMHAANPMGVAWHESLHDFFAMLNENPTERSIKKDLIDASKAYHVNKQLKKLLEGHPEAIKQLDNDEERVAYMYQFWAEGLLKLGPNTNGIFDRLRKMFRDMLKLVGAEDRAADLLGALHEGKFADPSTVSEVLSDLGADRFQNKLNAGAPVLAQALSRAVEAAPDRLRAFKNDKINELADKFSSEKGKTGFIQKRDQQGNMWGNKLAGILAGTSASERTTARKNLQAMKAPVSKLEQDLSQFFRDMHDYMTQAKVQTFDSETNQWVPLRQVKNYFPRVFDRAAILDNKDEFVELLRKHGDMSAKNAGKIVDALTHGTGQLDLVENEHSLGFTPYAQAVQDRKLTFINASNAAEFAKFQSPDLADITTGYVKQAVHRAEYTREFGNDGEKIVELIKASGIKDKKELEDIGKVVQGLEGSLGHEMSSSTKELMSSILTLQHMVILPMALFSQMIDPVVMAARSGDLKDAGKAYMTAVKRLVGKKVDGEELATTLGIISQDTVLEAMGMAYGATQMSRSMRNINRTFFKYNGLQGWNNSMRIAATAAGERYLISNKDNAKALSELGLKSGDITVLPSGRLDTSSPELQQAMFRFVDQAVLRPSASNRPVWMSDPRFLLVAHLKQFTFAMHNVVLKRAKNELADGNPKPWAILLLALPTILAADMAKFALSGNLPDSWGFMDYLNHAVERSGLLGLGDFTAQAQRGVGQGKMPGEALLGPSFEHLMEVLRWIGGDPRTGVTDVIDRTVPGARFV